MFISIQALAILSLTLIVCIAIVAYVILDIVRNK